MTLYSFLALLVSNPAVDQLRGFLTSAAQNPELAPIANEWLARLDAAVSEESVEALIPTLKQEFANIAAFKLDPRDHASDAI